MAHLAKLKSGNVTGSLRHDRRESNVYSNENIDSSRTHLNYSYDYYFNPTNEHRGTKYVIDYGNRFLQRRRKDVNYMLSWVVPLPLDVRKGDAKKFFDACVHFMCYRYGFDNLKNIIDAVVHMDETNPHLHFKFIPIGKDPKTGTYKLRASLVCGRHDLRTFHKDLSEYVAKELGYEVSIETEKKERVSMSELKAETKIQAEHREKVEKLESRIKVSERKIERKSVEVPDDDVEVANAFNRSRVIERQSSRMRKLEEALNNSMSNNSEMMKIISNRNEIIRRNSCIEESLKREKEPLDYMKDYYSHKQKVSERATEIAQENLEIRKTELNKFESLKTQSRVEKLRSENPFSLEMIKELPKNLMSLTKNELVKLSKSLVSTADRLQSEVKKLESRVRNLESRNRSLSRQVDHYEQCQSSNFEEIASLQKENEELKASLEKQKNVSRNLSSQNQELTESLVVRSESSKEQLQKSDDFISDLLERSFGLPEDSRNIVLKSLRENPDSKTAWRTLNWQIAKEEEKTHFRGRSL